MSKNGRKASHPTKRKKCKRTDGDGEKVGKKWNASGKGKQLERAGESGVWEAAEQKKPDFGSGVVTSKSRKSAVMGQNTSGRQAEWVPGEKRTGEGAD